MKEVGFQLSDCRYEEDGDMEIRSQDIRPRARTVIPLSQVKNGDTVMVNFNMDDPKHRGYWYDALVTGKKETRTSKELYATVYFG